MNKQNLFMGKLSFVVVNYCPNVSCKKINQSTMANSFSKILLLEEVGGPEKDQGLG